MNSKHPLVRKGGDSISIFNGGNTSEGSMRFVCARKERGNGS